MALLCRPYLTVRTTVTEMRNLNAMGIVIGSRISEAKWQHSTAKVNVDVVIIMESQVKIAIKTL